MTYGNYLDKKKMGRNKIPLELRKQPVTNRTSYAVHLNEETLTLLRTMKELYPKKFGLGLDGKDKITYPKILKRCLKAHYLKLIDKPDYVAPVEKIEFVRQGNSAYVPKPKPEGRKTKKKMAKFNALLNATIVTEEEDLGVNNLGINEVTKDEKILYNEDGGRKRLASLIYNPDYYGIEGVPGVPEGFEDDTPKEEKKEKDND